MVAQCKHAGQLAHLNAEGPQASWWNGLKVSSDLSPLTHKQPGCFGGFDKSYTDPPPTSVPQMGRGSHLCDVARVCR